MAPSMGPLLFLISFLYYTSGQQWDASNYPNPTTGGFKQCNMRSSANLCDPDQVLTESQRYRLNNDLNQLEQKTRQEHGRNFCEKKGITGAIALVKRVKGGSQQAVQAMANDMLKKWNLDRQCQKAVVIVVAVDDRKFWVARGPKVPVYGQELTDIFNSQKNQFANGEYSQALDNILKAIVDATLAKQGPGAAPAPGGDRGRAQPQPGTVGDKGKGGEGFKWPISPWILLAIVVFVVIPILCCCCCLYFCCCRNSNDNRRQGPSDGETGGGGQPFTSSDTGPGGGGRGGGRFGNIGSILGGLGGGAAINGIMNRFRNRGGGGGAGGGLPPQQGGGAYPPADQYAGGKQPGLYPSVPKEDQGGGGGW